MLCKSWWVVGDGHIAWSRRKRSCSAVLVSSFGSEEVKTIVLEENKSQKTHHKYYYNFEPTKFHSLIVSFSEI